MAVQTTQPGTTEIQISAPKFAVAEFVLRGTAPYVQGKFGASAREAMRNTQLQGSTKGKGKKREAKDFDSLYLESMYSTAEGWRGIPATAFQAAMVSACRIVGFKMTIAKLAIQVIADGYDVDESTPLIKITHGEPEKIESIVKNANNSTDLRVRARWNAGWEAVLRVRYDADQFTMTDVANLIYRVGQQVGVGHGRPDSKMSSGQAWGLFEIVKERVKKAA